MCRQVGIFMKGRAFPPLDPDPDEAGTNFYLIGYKSRDHYRRGVDDFPSGSLPESVSVFVRVSIASPSLFPIESVAESITVPHLPAIVFKL